MSPLQSPSSSPAKPPSSRRTRFVCISDTHNCTVKLPEGDVLIHAGDLTNKGSYTELERAVRWLESTDFEVKIVIAGNHDVTLDADFYAEHGSHIHNAVPQSPVSCLSLLASHPSILYLDQDSATISLRSPSGPQTTFKVYGSPYSPRIGTWAFGYERAGRPWPTAEPPAALDSSNEAIRPIGQTGNDIWSKIPLDADVVVTHTPPNTHCDEAVSARRALGCEELRQALWRVRPRLLVCGHVHEGRGVERVSWDINGGPGSANVAYKEASVERWMDPGAGVGNKKLSLVDLTARSGKRALDNDGSHNTQTDEASILLGDHPAVELSGATPGCGTRGLGGDPATSDRCDRDALIGRMGRKETCIVNAAIMANNYPHIGGKRFNKPIVVDIDLPVWE
jgi:Icc-related predicted phosphoesterase